MLRKGYADSLLLDLTEPSGAPLHLRLTTALRRAIREERLRAGAKLPPSRLLAAELGCSRWIVTEAYSQLVIEGYLSSRVGSGTRVRESAHAASDDRPHLKPPGKRSTFDLTPGLPDLAAFPRREWASACRDMVATISDEDLTAPDPAGHFTTRNAVADYLCRVRGAAGDAHNVVITTSATEGLLRICRTLRQRGIRIIAVENPTWPRIARTITDAGLELAAIDVDAEGLIVPHLYRNTSVGAVIVTPGHQYPTGVALSDRRREALLAWARESDALIIEDDYDAEFAYERRPASVLQCSAPERVALVGSVSKTLSPAVRIGWIFGPQGLCRDIVDADDRLGTPPVFFQLALAQLIETGVYSRHLQRSRLRYRQRRDRLLDAIRRQLPDAHVGGAAAGSHVVLKFGHLTDGPSVVMRAAKRNVELTALEDHYIAAPKQRGLVVGYGNLADDRVEAAIEQLAAAVQIGQG